MSLLSQPYPTMWNRGTIIPENGKKNRLTLPQDHVKACPATFFDHGMVIATNSNE